MQNLFDAAADCLSAIQPADKIARTFAAAAAFRDGRLSLQPPPGPPAPIGVPGRPERPRLVPPRDLPQRGLGSVEGRAGYVHAIAHIEFNAINLAWDAVYRFRGLPPAFYADWVGVAEDEARHFQLLEARLAALGSRYGAFDAHDGLWDMARRTAHDLLLRMALVPRVLEARGLDVTPDMIRRLRSLGEHGIADDLEIILREEVAHVAAGTRWYHWACARDGVADPDAHFAALMAEHAGPVLRRPFNREARLASGFSLPELAALERHAAGS